MSTNSKTSMICKDCDKEIETHYFPDVVKRLRTKQLCFYCDFWDEVYKDINERPRPAFRQAIAITKDYDVYYINIVNVGDAAFMLGFGGRKWRFVLQDCRSLESNDVWMRGKVPHHLRHKFHPNVVSMEELPIYPSGLEGF